MRVFKTRGARGLPAARGADGDTVSYYAREACVPGALALGRGGRACAGCCGLRELRRWRRCALAHTQLAACWLPPPPAAPRRPREMPESYIDGVIDLIRVILLILTRHGGRGCPVSSALAGSCGCGLLYRAFWRRCGVVEARTPLQRECPLVRRHQPGYLAG